MCPCGVPEIWDSRGHGSTPSFQFSGPLNAPLLSAPAPQVSLLIRLELTERAKDFSLILDDVAITELSFSREYTAAVEAKQVGESGEGVRGSRQARLGSHRLTSL